VNPSVDATVELMLLLKKSRFNFRSAARNTLRQARRMLFNFLAAGVSPDAAQARYQELIAQKPTSLASFFNLTSAMEQNHSGDWNPARLFQADSVGCFVSAGPFRCLRRRWLIEQKNADNERLLLNILPGVIAERLKHGEHSIADGFAEVTVLFADAVGFTTFSAHTPPAELVSLLNDLFSRFDAASQRHGIEKIKTIGDCYIAVCGLLKPRPDHARAMTEMALDMLRVLGEFNRDRGTNLQVRIGLNSGPVVAGVIGSIKFVYDLWGDTVNLASRMESTGVPGAIQGGRERLPGAARKVQVRGAQAH